MPRAGSKAQFHFRQPTNQCSVVIHIALDQDSYLKVDSIVGFSCVSAMDIDSQTIVYILQEDYKLPGPHSSLTPERDICLF